MSGETPISPRDEVSHEVFGQGLVEEVRGDVVTVRFARAGRKTILRDYLVRQTAGGLPHRRPDALTLFDAYLMVDWSANSRPKTGKDSVWWCLHEPESGRVLLENPPTREQGLHEVRASLTRLLSQGQRVLVGFDFPYGFPRGTAERLGVAADRPWRVLWEEVAGLVEDHPDNKNNRFEVAAELNGALTGGPAPFWGCPQSKAGASLNRPLKYPGWSPSDVLRCSAA